MSTQMFTDVHMAEKDHLHILIKKKNKKRLVALTKKSGRKMGAEIDALIEGAEKPNAD